MKNSIINSFDIWTNAQGLKSKGRVKSIENISLEGLARLRELILDLAFRGLLIKQNENDSPASKLLKDIQSNDVSLKSTGFKNSKNMLPNGWVACKLGNVIRLEMGQSPDGKTYNETGEGLPLINGPVEFGPGPFDKTLKTKFTTAPTKICDEGDLLVCVRGATTGRTNIAGFSACIGRGVASIKSYIYQHYVNYFMLKSRYSLLNLGTGTTFPSISKEDIINFNFLLPPLAEQKRIVAKVDELMALCDLLEGMPPTNPVFSVAKIAC